MSNTAADRKSEVPLVGRVGFLVSALVGLLVLLVFVQTVRETRHDTRRGDAKVSYMPSGDTLQRLALSFDSAMADVYWIRAIQHYGGTKRDEASAKQYELLYPLLDITTTLDPRFNIAYRFGAIFLTEAYPDGPGRPDQAIALLQKGVREMPDRWQYLLDIGFVHYWWLADYEEAARWFQRASEVPGSAEWLRSLAANTLAVGGNWEDARVLWGEVRRSSDNEWMRREANRRLLQLDALDELDQYARAVERFVVREGRGPTSWHDLEDRLVGPQASLDPAGYPYILDPRSGAVSLSPQSPLFPLPTGSRPVGSP